MIPYEFALLAYIPVAALMMILRDNAKAFSLAYLIGIMFLPSERELELLGLPDLSKSNVPAIGILIGTVLFHPRAFDRFRFTVLDFAFIFGAMCAFLTAMLNDFGLKFGASQTMDVGLSFFLPVVLARIHLGTPRGFRIFVITLVILACVYVPLALWEFRMSPQLHTTTYGYFQHVFQQHMRGSFWRPIVFFYHALSLGRFFAFTAFLALFPLRAELIRLFGRAGGYLFLLPLAGLLASQSVSPVMLLVLISVLYHLILRMPRIVWVMPLLGFVWITAVFADIEIGFDTFRAAPVSRERVESFQYRLDALQEYRSIVLTKPWFGWGGFGSGRIEGRATDSQLLVRLLESGILGASAYFAWWLGAMGYAASLVRRARGAPLANYAAAFAAFASIGITYTVVDAAVDHFMMFGLAGLCGIASAPRQRVLPSRSPKSMQSQEPLAHNQGTVEAH